MSVGPRTRALTRITSEARRHQVAAAYAALTQACTDTGDNAARAELISEHPQHAWWLPASNALALVHADADEAGALLRGVRVLDEHRVAVVVPDYDRVRIAHGQAVTFWRHPGQPVRDAAASARATAAVHRIHPNSALWLEDHDPFNGLLDGLDDTTLDEADQWFLRRCSAELREEWDRVEWPTPSAVILGARGMAACYDAGPNPGLFPQRPLWRGHREWDLVAARWRSELLRGHRDDLHAYTAAYTAHGRAELAPPYSQIGAWPDYQTVRDVVVLTAVMDTVRRAHLDAHLRRQAAHQVACLRGAHQPPWNWGRR
ncbi:hypothetical protein ACFWIQ_08340 [Kitasatospora sp. NPDC127059]|uniref:hypothetical protein n=1 Tax=unclassified Kitasatospora TaxID=2633591 RepID=UPI0036460091